MESSSENIDPVNICNTVLVVLIFYCHALEYFYFLFQVIFLEMEKFPIVSFYLISWSYRNIDWREKREKNAGHEVIFSAVVIMHMFLCLRLYVFKQ